MELIRPFVGVFLLSIAFPLGIYFGRNNIRARRRELVIALQTMFAYAKNEKNEDLILPSVDLVRYKYDPDSKPKNLDIEAKEESAIRPILNYSVPVFIYISLTFLGFLLTFVGPTATPNPSPYVLGGMVRDEFNDAMKAGFYGTVSYTFLGAYIWTIFYLLKRVSNFDLSPLSYLRASAHILFALFVSSVLWHLVVANGWTGTSHGAGESNSVGLGTFGAVTVALAFLIGFFPDLAFKAIAAKYPWMRLKRVASATRDLYEEIPLDCIIGIDPFIKFRLGDFEIEDVQNLATINPIQLFVESPYTLYEVIDWVAQAQLILAVGSEKTLQLRRLGIRTIFDIEKALNSRTMSEIVTAILIPQHNTLQKQQTTTGAREIEGNDLKDTTVTEMPANPLNPGGTDPNLIRTMIAIINEDLHVQRLRQLWDVISMRLDERPMGFSERIYPKPFSPGIAAE